MRSPASAGAACLHQLIEQWRAKGAALDTTHATMGMGWKVCADELDACRESLVVALQALEQDLLTASVAGPEGRWPRKAKEWAEQVADLRTQLEGPTRAPGAP